MRTSAFTPVTVTAETLGVLAKQDNYASVLALYMAYVEISAWQDTRSIKATREFMAKRLRWRPDKVSRIKKKLIELDLVRDVIKKNKQGRVVGHYVLVRHITSDNHLLSIGATGFEEQMANGATSTNRLKESTNNLNKVQLVEVFEELKKILSTSGLYTLTNQRQSHLKQRLLEFSPEQLYTAARNLAKDPWNNGDNPRNKKYAYPHFLIRSRDKVEEWLLVETEQEDDRYSMERLEASKKKLLEGLVYADEI